MSEISEKINEIFQDFKGRIRNPLILSFIFVWIYFHWDIILILLDKSLISEIKITKIKEIIKSEKWCGMLGKPIGIAFLSLLFYYLIAIFAQGLKILVGKRLYVSVEVWLDRGKYILKSELEAERTKVKKLNDEFIKANEILIGFNDEKQKLEEKVRQNEINAGRFLSEKKELEGNALASKSFIQNFKHTLLFLLTEANKIKTPAVSKEVLNNHYRPLNGNWQTFSGNQIHDNSGLMKYYFITDNIVYGREGNPYGTINEMQYDKKNQIIRFKMRIDSQNVNNSLYLLRLNDNELIGFEEGNYIQFKRLVD